MRSSRADFRTMLRRTENSPWYGAKKQGARYIGSGNTQAGQRGGVQGTAQPHTMKAHAGGFVYTVLDVATSRRYAARILKT